MSLHRLAAVLLMCLAAFSLQAQEVGQVVDLDRGAWVTSTSGKSRLQPGTRISMKDVIETDGAGRAQLVFDDGTKIAVGPRSKLVIDEVLMRSGTRASRFAVNAVSGSMRFITGKSPKSAYSITTPTATMGIRGTAFEISMKRRDSTDLVLFSGIVTVCTAAGCQRVSNACQAVTATSFGKILETRDEGQKGQLISRNFPLIVRQASLRPDFQLPLERCGDRVSRIVERAAIGTPPERPDRETPVAPPPPPPPPPHPPHPI